jgi:molybdate transport system ATP-binding protein
MHKPLVNIAHLNLSYRQKVILDDLNWTINAGENWLLTGESGSGKTSLVKLIAGPPLTQLQFNFDESSNLPPRSFYVENWYQFKNLEGVANFYYQQRYTSVQAKDTHTVQTELNTFGAANQLDFEQVAPLLKSLGFEKLKNATLIELSSGEHKKLQLVKALWLKPQLLILDEPYTGLDVSSRLNLNGRLDSIVASGVQLILISNEEELPRAINRFATLSNGKLTVTPARIPTSAVAEKTPKILPNFLKERPKYTSTNLITMNNVKVSYGEKVVLNHINWTVNPGEKWLLQGHNGSGKSTLLSLVNGDHPQAYANDIHLFGNKRGSGESIWDIKKHIGLISPELHWYFDQDATVWQSIASGFEDSIGLFSTLVEGKRRMVNELISFFSLEDYTNELLNSLPLGKQRLVLLARTIIKIPELLILDEPCQGLDRQQTQHFNELIDELCGYGMTLIYVAHHEDQLPKCINNRLVLQQGEVLTNTKIYQPQKEFIS